MSGLDPDYESIQEDMWHDEQPIEEDLDSGVFCSDRRVDG